MANYRTNEGDTVDYIAYKYYGNTNNRIVEKILDANSLLAEQGPILPAGLILELPEQTQTPVLSNRKVKLWD